MPAPLSSGLLLPSLKGVPLDLPYPNRASCEWRAGAIQSFLDLGVIKPSEYLDDPVETGFSRLFTGAVHRLDDEMDIIRAATDSEDPKLFIVAVDTPSYPGCSFSLGLLLERLQKIAKRRRRPEVVSWGMRYVALHPLIGRPYAWSDIASYVPSSPGEDRNLRNEEDEDGDFDTRKVMGATEYVTKAIQLYDAATNDDRPHDPEEMLKLVRSCDPKLADLLENCLSNPFSNSAGGVLFAASWKPNDVVEHLWDFLYHLISEGTLECNDPAAGEFAGTIPEIAHNAKNLCRAADAVDNLNKYLEHDLRK